MIVFPQINLMFSKFSQYSFKASFVSDDRDSFSTEDAVVITAVAADAYVGEKVFAIDHLGAFRTFAPETITLFGFLSDLDHGLTLAAISEPVEKRHGDDPDQPIKRRTGPRTMPPGLFVYFRSVFKSKLIVFVLLVLFTVSLKNEQRKQWTGA